MWILDPFLTVHVILMLLFYLSYLAFFLNFSSHFALQHKEEADILWLLSIRKMVKH